jgi:C-terminal processing protease CtpA/Prc
VDTQKLFETGVTAMLRSLDPYTEFEGKSEAVAMQESVAGKYAGVGLVISGPNSRQMELLNSLDDDDDSSVITSGEIEDAAAADSPPSTLLNFINNNYKGTDMKKQQINLIKDQQIKDTITENAAATQDNRKINVVAAFEGYAFDAGMRVGDRIVAVDDFVVNRDTTVDGRYYTLIYIYIHVHAPFGFLQTVIKFCNLFALNIDSLLLQRYAVG